MLPVTRILCATDFSDVSTKAEAYAVAMARRHGARLRLLHVAPPLPLVAQYGELPLDVRMFDEQRLDTERAMQAARARAQAAGVPTDADLLDGAPVSEILDASRSADLVVLGTHGRGGFDRLMLGSVAEKVLRNVRCAVMVVPATSRPEHGVCFAKVLCPTDGSAQSPAAIDAAVALMRETGGTLHLLEVVEAMPVVTEFDAVQDAAYATEAEALARSRLHAAVGAEVRRRCRVVEDVSRGKASERILAAAQATAADLIVMGVRGRHALDLFAFGSTTNEVVRRAGCPVLVVHPPRDRAPDMAWD